MNVSLTPELEKFVEQEVGSGLYQTASEVVRAGLRLLKREELLKQVAVGSPAELYPCGRCSLSQRALVSTQVSSLPRETSGERDGESQPDGLLSLALRMPCLIINDLRICRDGGARRA